ncbi:hypothetical protein [Nostoc sp.]|uniref:hypothetical protein n=1 Tax=Nostoc sp. TaxID=1180 RepID=UPI002FF9C1A1
MKLCHLGKIGSGETRLIASVREWGAGSREQGRRITNQCPMPNAQCPLLIFDDSVRPAGIEPA